MSECSVEHGRSSSSEIKASFLLRWSEMSSCSQYLMPTELNLFRECASLSPWQQGGVFRWSESSILPSAALYRHKVYESVSLWSDSSCQGPPGGRMSCRNTRAGDAFRVTHDSCGWSGCLITLQLIRILDTLYLKFLNIKCPVQTDIVAQKFKYNCESTAKALYFGLVFRFLNTALQTEFLVVFFARYF